MVINAFSNKIIQLADDSYSQYYEKKKISEEPYIYWVEKPEEFINFADYLKYEVKEGFNVKTGQKKQNVGLSKVRKFVKDINSGKINNMESAVDRYLKDISPDKDFLDATKIIYGAPSYILKEIFNDFEYAVFGSLGPKNRKKTR